jgi:hypothetical protein
MRFVCVFIIIIIIKLMTPCSNLGHNLLPFIKDAQSFEFRRMGFALHHQTWGLSSLKYCFFWRILVTWRQRKIGTSPRTLMIYLKNLPKWARLGRQKVVNWLGEGLSCCHNIGGIFDNVTERQFTSLSNQIWLSPLVEFHNKLIKIDLRNKWSIKSIILLLAHF